ncbi:MAG: hypothetical protein KC550_07605 [Nanoarchaeota archaeon]|nr:hypothetical protein [Nanoarchaeota archaeon]
MSNQLENKHPMELFGRMVLLNNLKQIGAKKVSMLVEEQRADFIKQELQAPSNSKELKEDGIFKHKWVINWEFAIFDATDEQWETLMSNFIKRGKPSDAQKSILVDKSGNSL